MKTYKCEYVEYIDCQLIVGEYQAATPQEAYEKFLGDQQVVHNVAVVVTVSGDHLDVGETFKDHLKNIEEQTKKKKALAKKVKTAEAMAHSSLAATDILLRQLIEKQNETNQWLRKIRWVLLAIGFILMIWNIRVFR